MLVLCAGLITVALIAGLGGTRLAASQSAETIDLIAYVGPDNNLYVVDRQGEDVEQVAAGPEGLTLGHPTWSPDGHRIAYLAQPELGAGRETILYAVSPGENDPTRLYASVENPAFYLYWSPNSQYLTFLTQEASGLALRLSPADGSADARILEEGAPFYWSWSPNSQELFMHIGGTRRFSQEARLSILSQQPESTPALLDEAPANFQAPAWSSDGERLLYAAEDEDGNQALYLREQQSGVATKLINVSGFVGVAWSPDGRWIAYHQIESAEMSPLGHVFVMPAPEGTQAEAKARQVSTEPAIAFFWSPDSQHLAVLTPSLDENDSASRGIGLAAPMPQAAELFLRWWVMDLPDGELRPLVAFRPTRTFLPILPFFDQYAHSMRFWSPDSRYLVYSHQESADQSGVWIADIRSEEAPRRLADGSIAVWSWR
jgi:Tol biopolymer transport system component